MYIYSNSSTGAATRIFILAEDNDATGFISFVHPLSGGRSCYRYTAMSYLEAISAEDSGILEKIQFDVARFTPHFFILSRLTRNVARFIKTARRLGSVVIYFLDDNLLEIPPSVGEQTYKRFASSAVRSEITYALNHVDLVYVSTKALAESITRYTDRPVFHGDIYRSASSADIAAATPRNEKSLKFGYMGSASHSEDLKMVAEPIAGILEAREDVTFELFGTIALPQELANYSSRIKMHPKQASYGDFLKYLKNLDWQVGIAPLSPHPFNECKAPTKWIEYSLGGIPTVASIGRVYERAISTGSAIPAGTGEQWIIGISKLLDSDEKRLQLLKRSRSTILGEFSTNKHRSQLRTVLTAAAEFNRNRRYS